jgi:hypothetical protein
MFEESDQYPNQIIYSSSKMQRRSKERKKNIEYESMVQRKIQGWVFLRTAEHVGALHSMHVGMLGEWLEMDEAQTT